MQALTAWVCECERERKRENDKQSEKQAAVKCPQVFSTENMVV